MKPAAPIIRYVLFAGYLLALLALAVYQARLPPVSGVEMFYTGPKLPLPTYLYHAESTRPDYSPDRVSLGQPERTLGIFWKTRFTLPASRDARLVRIDPEPGTMPISLISLTYLGDLPLLGKIALYEETADRLAGRVLYPSDLGISHDPLGLHLKVLDTHPRFSLLIDPRQIAANTPAATRLMIVAYRFLLLTLASLAMYLLARRAGDAWRAVSGRPPAAAVRRWLGEGLQLQPAHDRIVMLVTLASLVAINLARLWPNLSVPGLYYEDSGEYFSHVNAATTLFDLALFTQHGYSSFITIVAAWLFSFFSYGLQPYLYIVFAFSLALAPIVVVATSGLFRQRGFAIFAAVVISLVGYNHVFYYTTLAYGIYTSIILLLLLALLARPRSLPGLLGYLLAMSVLIWSGPYAVTLVPLGLLLLLLDRGGSYRRWLLLLVIFETIVCYLATRAGGDGPGLTLSAEALSAYFVHLSRDVVFLGLFDETYLYPLSVLIPPLVLLPFHRDRDFTRIGGLLIVIIYTSHALFFVTDKFLQYGEPKPGHLAIPVFFWVVLLLMITERFFLRYTGNTLARAVLLASILGLTVAINLARPEHHSYPVNRELPHYLETADRLETIMPQHPGGFVVLRMKSMAQQPLLFIGSRDATARQLGRSDVAIGTGSRFIVEPDPGG